MHDIKEIVIHKIISLNVWLEQNGWFGYDPYDIKGGRCVIWLTRRGNHSKIFAIIREVVFELFYTFPKFCRKIFKIEPQINAKAMGLFASGYLGLYQAIQNEEYLAKSTCCMDWLLNHPSKTKIGIGWGYPFDWQSRELIPRGTPNGIVTTAAGEAFWRWYKHTGEKKYLEVCKKTGLFLASLPIKTVEEDKICFSYTPLYVNYIHNLNLFVAEFLLKVGLETNNNMWIELAGKAVNYTISCQMDSGAFDYNGPPEKPANFIDNYHTGFVLRMLFSIYKLTGRKDVLESLRKGYGFYKEKLFENYQIPRLRPHRKYRIDIHSCSEGILCFSTLSEIFPEALQYAESIAKWTIENFQDESGYFYYGILKSRFIGIPFKSKIAYLRWGQAWMLPALTNLLLVKSKNAG
ncbi:hypothetical protein ES705_10285 [subsurface metagenome]